MVSENKYHWLLWLSLSLYSFTSYLILLKDHFILERLGISLQNSQIENFGIFLSNLLKVNYSSTILISLSLVLGVFSWFKLVFSNKKVFNWKWVSVYLLTVVVSFPSLSTDIFDYNNANRVAYIHQQNPWEVPANAFSNDSEIYFGSWINRGSVYPPVTFVFSSLVYFIFGAKTLFAVIGFKIIALVFYLLIVFSLKQQKISESRLISLAYNPLVLVEFIGNGHNDLILGFFLLLSFIYFEKYKSYLGSGIFLALGVMSKFSLILYLPFFLWKMIVRYEWKQIFKWSLGFILASLIIISLFLNSLKPLIDNLADQFSIYQKSLPAVLNLMGIQPKFITLLIFSLISLFILSKSKSLNLADFLVLIMITYLFIQAPMLQPWYLAWFLPLIPLVKSQKIFYGCLIFCASALATYPMYFVSLYLNPLSIIWQLILALTMIFPPIFYLLSQKE